MIPPRQALEGVYEHKLDAKCRVSFPSDWRKFVGDGYLRLLQSTKFDVKVLRVLTEQKFESMLQEVENDEELTYAEKEDYVGELYSSVLKTTMNAQGKLLIPKALCDRVGIVPDSHVVMLGRGKDIFIFSPENYEEMQARQVAKNRKANDKFGFF